MEFKDININNLNLYGGNLENLLAMLKQSGKVDEFKHYGVIIKLPVKKLTFEVVHQKIIISEMEQRAENPVKFFIANDLSFDVASFFNYEQQLLNLKQNKALSFVYGTDKTTKTFKETTDHLNQIVDVIEYTNVILCQFFYETNSEITGKYMSAELIEDPFINKKIVYHIYLHPYYCFILNYTIIINEDQAKCLLAINIDKYNYYNTNKTRYYLKRLEVENEKEIESLASLIINWENKDKLLAKIDKKIEIFETNVNRVYIFVLEQNKFYVIRKLYISLEEFLDDLLRYDEDDNGCALEKCTLKEVIYITKHISKELSEIKENYGRLKVIKLTKKLKLLIFSPSLIFLFYLSTLLT